MNPYDQLENRINKLEVSVANVIDEVTPFIEDSTHDMNLLRVEIMYLRLLLVGTFVGMCAQSVNVLKESDHGVSLTDFLSSLSGRGVGSNKHKLLRSRLMKKLGQYLEGRRPMPTLTTENTFDEEALSGGVDVDDIKQRLCDLLGFENSGEGA